MLEVQHSFPGILLGMIYFLSVGSLHSYLLQICVHSSKLPYTRNIHMGFTVHHLFSLFLY